MINKNYQIEKQYLFKPTLHRVLYRYFKHVVFPAKAISRSPLVFVNYLKQERKDFVLTEEIMKAWDEWELFLLNGMKISNALNVFIVLKLLNVFTTREQVL
jgi:hypothetical protein